jgi:hypothetical protein
MRAHCPTILVHAVTSKRTRTPRPARNSTHRRGERRSILVD